MKFKLIDCDKIIPESYKVILHFDDDADLPHYQFDNMLFNIVFDNDGYNFDNRNLNLFEVLRNPDKFNNLIYGFKVEDKYGRSITCFADKTDPRIATYTPESLDARCQVEFNIWQKFMLNEVFVLEVQQYNYSTQLYDTVFQVNGLYGLTAVKEFIEEGNIKIDNNILKTDTVAIFPDNRLSHLFNVEI